MKYADFRKKLEAKFPFKKGDVNLPGGQVLAHVSPGGIKTQLRGFNGTAVKNANAHFGATAIMDSPGPDEIIHITEPGSFFDQVFWLDHEVLYSLDDLNDLELLMDVVGYDEDQYRDMTGEERIEIMPFFKEKLANSLQSFFNGIRVIDQEELNSRGKSKVKKATAKKTTLKKVTAKTGGGKAKPAKAFKPPKGVKPWEPKYCNPEGLKYMDRWNHQQNIYLKSAKQYTYVHFDEKNLEIVASTLGAKRRAPIKRSRYSSGEKALKAAEDYIDKMLAAGFKFTDKI